MLTRTDRLIGTFGLAIEGIAFAIYIAAFTLARQEVRGANLPLHRHFVQGILLLILLAAVLSFIGLFVDRRRHRSIIAITLLIPLLAVIGILAGNF